MRSFAFLLTIFVFAAATLAQSNKPNPIIVNMINQVSVKRIEEDIRKLVSFGTRNTNSSQDDPKRGIGAARDWIFNQFKEISISCKGCLKVEKQSFEQQPTANRRILKPTIITNVYAVLPGTTDPNRIYVVSAHYDSMCANPADGECDAPGANDDASGVAAVLEMARIMSLYKFDATIIFLAVAGEEQGLLGSTYFAEQAKRENWNIEAMFTNDIIGGVTTFKDAPDRQNVRVFSEGVPSNETETEAIIRRSVGGENDSPSRQLARFIKETAEIYSPNFGVKMIFRRDRYLRGGDHIPFLERGFPAVRFTEMHEDYNHQHQNVRTENGKFYGDTPEYVDFQYVANVTKINLASLARLALAPAKPKNVVIVTTQLTNDTELRWEASTENDIAGYEIVWRETTEPTWTNSIFVGNVTSYVMKNMSKDNYFFGVRAVDKDGNKSPVSFPRPSGR
ncbi:MAG: M20/M25/M40 family metallo-hydrolase [Acidobacteria bacterium]|jgi:acetylornithine deacetylase/succinyl-diaminopimelate desuccinylase-like protein|nr:MAG: M20/M25/M40 family metallo-hydrolase [Acidobacteriota bacterium]GIU82515.1 MAG: aminopeptidase [Pyrinomonadaceae bacterium]